MLDLSRTTILLGLFVGACGAAHAGEQESRYERPLGLSGNWERIFTDEFDAPRLNEDRWTTCYWWNNNGCTNLGNNELEWYLPDNVTLVDGHLRLRAREEQATGHEGRIFPYTSGMVTTGRDYAELPRPPRAGFRYGYFEVRAKLPSGQGLWPAIWLLPASRKSKPEIDILEALGDRPRVMRMHFHYLDKGGKKRSPGHDAETSDLSKRWHVYGLEWGPRVLIWYLDGIEQWRFTDGPIPDEQMYLLINMAVGGDWPGPPDSNTVFPADFLVDYVRVWQRVGHDTTAR